MAYWLAKAAMKTKRLSAVLARPEKLIGKLRESKG